MCIGACLIVNEKRLDDILAVWPACCLVVVRNAAQNNAAENNAVENNAVEMPVGLGCTRVLRCNMAFVNARSSSRSNSTFQNRIRSPVRRLGTFQLAQSMIMDLSFSQQDGTKWNKRE